MLDAGIKTPALLDELESHLRDDVQQRMKSGGGAQEAFEGAAQCMGLARALTTEFKKVGATPQALQRLMVFIGLALTAFILCMSGFTFWYLGMSLAEQIVAYCAVACSLVVAGGWRYAVPFLPVLPNKRARNIVGAACILAGFVCSNLFGNFVLPHFERQLEGRVPAIGFWLVFPIAVGFGLAGGIQEAARRRRATTVS